MRRAVCVALLLLAAISESRCSMPAGMNDEYKWPPEQAAPLDLNNPAHQRHLVKHVRAAEELGMRYLDWRLRRRRSRPDQPQTREDCDTKLFLEIARTHAVSLDDVRRARQRLADTQWDAWVLLPLAVFYTLTARAMARRIRRRFPPDEPMPAVAATVFVSIVIGIVFVPLGRIWAGVVEMIRLGDMHMCYRAARLGWHRDAGGVFALAVLVFWFVVLLYYWMPRMIDPRLDAP